MDLKRFLMIVVLGFVGGLTAQTTLVSNQAGLSQKKSNYRKALGVSNNQIYTCYSSNADLSEGFVVEQYSSDMIFQRDRKIEAQGKERILRLVMGDSFLYWVGVVKVKRREYQLLYHRLDLELQGKVVSQGLGVVSDLELEPSNWEVVVSEDRKYLGLFVFGVQSQPMIDGYRHTVAQGFSFAQDGKRLDSFRIELSADFGLDDVVWRSAEVNVKGDMAMIYEDHVSGAIRLGGRRDSGHFHAIVRLHGSTLHQRLSLAGDIVEVAVSKDVVSSDFLLSGFWSAMKQSGIQGHFTGRVRDYGSDERNQQQDIALETHLWSDRQCRQLAGLLAVKKSSKPEDYFIRTVVPLSHGGQVILAEEFFETKQMETYYVNGVPQTNSKLFYHYGDVAAMYLSAKGDLDTVVMLRKTQVGTVSNAYLFGFAHYVCAGSLNLVYNDLEGEMNRVMHVKIDNTFAVEKEWLFRSESIPGSIVPYEGLHTDYCTLTVPIYRDKQWHWLQIYSHD
jgi:hypothetical protein